jgi:hypothetical protein
MPLIEIFAFVQLLDALTTLIGMELGAQEINPIIRYFMQSGPVTGLVICKLGVAVLGGICVWRRQLRAIRIVNYLFAPLIVWNLSQLLLIVTRQA